jgi:hypothetical protein
VNKQPIFVQLVVVVVVVVACSVLIVPTTMEQDCILNYLLLHLAATCIMCTTSAACFP